MGIEVDAEAYARALAGLDDRATGETSQEEGAGLISALLQVPAVLGEAQRILTAAPQPNSLEEWARKTPLARHAFDYSNLALSAANDALLTLSILVLKGNAIPQLGIFTLCRQAVENSLTALWCVERNDPTTLATRGLAAAWKDNSDKTTFAEAIGYSDLVDAARTRKLDLLQQARAQGLLSKRANNPKPDILFPHYTDLFKNPPSPLSGTLEWLYRIVSGAAHGRGWAQINLSKTRETLEHLTRDDEGRLISLGTVVMTSEPNVSSLGEMTNLVLKLHIIALTRYDACATAPAPACT